MKNEKSSVFRYFKTLPEVISLAVMMYVRLRLSLRNVGEALSGELAELVEDVVVRGVASSDGLM